MLTTYTLVMLSLKLAGVVKISYGYLFLPILMGVTLQLIGALIQTLIMIKRMKNIDKE